MPEELQELIERGQRCIADIRRFLAESERRTNGGSPARRDGRERERLRAGGARTLKKEERGIV